MVALRYSWFGFAIAALLLTLASGVAAAADVRSPLDAPALDYRFDSADEPVAATGAPWLKQSDLLFNRGYTVFWNQNYRANRGIITVTPVEIYRYDYNNKTDRVDAGSIKEICHTATFAGTLIPCVKFFGTFGLITAALDLGDDGVKQFFNYTGLVYAIGIDVGLPLENTPLTFIVKGFWRQWEATRNQAGVNLDAFAFSWNGQAMVSFEILSEKNSGSWSAYAGVGWAYNVQRWEVQNGIVEQLTPDNAADKGQQNGHSRYSIIIGTNVMPAEWFSAYFEVRFIGPTLFTGGLNFQF